MTNKIWLVAGLGNPGSKYENNRHNVGFMLVDQLSEKFNISLNKKKFNGVYGKGKFNGADILLLKPFSFMNLSGNPIRELSQYFNVDISGIIIVHDDLDLPVGKIRIRKKGGAGGHNGIKSAIENLGTNEIGRVKIGIDRPEHREQVVSYVLKDFTKDESKIIENGIEKAAEAIESIILNGYTSSMNTFNK